MFDLGIEDYLKNKMNIDLNHLFEEINKFPDDKSLIKEFLEILVSINLPYKEFELGDSEFYKNQEYFNEQCKKFWDKNNINNEKDGYYIFDNLRHSFYSYKFGGLIQLYERAEKEDWYPKIVINSFLGKQEDIARRFAFVHYSGMINFSSTDRVLLKTVVNKDSIFYYDKDNNEKEVIINPKDIKKEFVEEVERGIIE
ncbi:hypothetical protein [Aliarcobacter butzleri]|uniref:hypothetical protein n=1 Tax=Aliarcobacter butzleri TaxID=28197 RepID=UPI000DB2B096|nr:hypothetical protein [Aliarcobacter butzleri]MCG3673053.1 hypothetical protein [Aliarcobacter butzleri]MCG3691398.1 hypothetical protein [Aliarcobacter butzleri]PZP15816.1 MAG: hypothetical protein DI602_01520 [Aliarcobacter butzleri]